MSAPATAVAKPKFRPRFKARRATAGSSDERSAGSGSAPAPAPAAPPTAPTSPHGAVSVPPPQVPPKRTAGRPVAPHGATEAPQQYDTSRGVAAAGGVGRRAGRPTIIRVKRKRTADPVDTLVVQSAVQRVTKSSRTSMDSLAAKFTASTSIEKGAVATGKAAAAGVPPPAGKVAAPGAGAGAGTGTSAADVGDASSSNTATQAPEHHRFVFRRVDTLAEHEAATDGEASTRLYSRIRNLHRRRARRRRSSAASAAAASLLGDTSPTADGEEWSGLRARAAAQAGARSVQPRVANVRRHKQRTASGRRAAVAKARAASRRPRRGLSAVFNVVDVVPNGDSNGSNPFESPVFAEARQAQAASKDVTCNRARMRRVKTAAAGAGKPVRIMTPPERQMDEAVWYASQGRFDGLLRRLTGEHSNPNYQRFMADQTTGLMAAAYHGRQDIAMSLLDAGAVVDLRDAEGRTAVDWASAAGHVQLASKLGSVLMAERMSKPKPKPKPSATAGAAASASSGGGGSGIAGGAGGAGAGAGAGATPKDGDDDFVYDYYFVDRFTSTSALERRQQQARRQPPTGGSGPTRLGLPSGRIRGDTTPDSPDPDVGTRVGLDDSGFGADSPLPADDLLAHGDDGTQPMDEAAVKPAAVGLVQLTQSIQVQDSDDELWLSDTTESDSGHDSENSNSEGYRYNDYPDEEDDSLLEPGVESESDDSEFGKTRQQMPFDAFGGGDDGGGSTGDVVDVGFDDDDDDDDSFTAEYSDHGSYGYGDEDSDVSGDGAVFMTA